MFKYLLLLALSCTNNYNDNTRLNPHESIINDPVLSALPDHYLPPPVPIRSPGDLPDMVVYGYWPYWGDPLDTVRFDQLTHVAIFSVDLNSNGTLSNTSRWLSNSQTAKTLGAPWSVEVHMVVTAFSDVVINTVLSSPQSRSVAIQNISNLLLQGGGDGVNIDFEGVDGSQRQNLVDFVYELRQQVDTVWIATPSVDWNGAWDYDQLANLSSGLFIMGYDYHWSGGNPGPVSPLYGGAPWAIHSIDWTVNDYRNYLTPNNKITVGLPLYGRSWSTTNNSIPGVSTGSSSSVTYINGLSQLSNYGRNIDQVSRTPYSFPNSTSQLWIDDEGSIREKIEYIVDEGLQGVGFWALTYEDSDYSFWTMVDQLTHLQNQNLLQISSISPGIARMVNTFVATGANPNSQIGFIAGVLPGSTVIPGCQFSVSTSGARIVGYAIADGSGTVTIGVWIPKNAQNKNMKIWAYDMATCEISQVFQETF
jgi:spore germination protein YaaH